MSTQDPTRPRTSVDAAEEAELAAQVGRSEPPAAAARPHGCDILIADDTGASRELLTAILRNFAGVLEMREARNGTEALALWEQFHPRITLLDIDMPGLDGLATLQRIRALAPQAFVAMVSAGSSTDNVRQALSLGASGFVIKPYKPQRILDLLTRYRDLSGHDLLGRTGLARAGER